MTLTEQWKAGKLEWYKSYYCQNTKGDVCIATLMGTDVLYSKELEATLNFGYWEVLSPVPSYEETQQLKDLLKECKPYVIRNVVFTTVNRAEVVDLEKNELLTKIDNAIGEKK